ncbi:MAG: glycine zipper 2TM domain-containing protein [Sneathiella sp.]
MITLKKRGVRTVIATTLGAVLLLSLPIAAAQADHRHRGQSYDNHDGGTVVTKTIVIRKVKKIYVYEGRQDRRYRHKKRHTRHHHVARKHRYYEHQAVYYPKPVHRRHSNSNFKVDSEFGGRIVGGILGGAAGTQVGKGRGRTVAIIGGAIIGSVIGGEVGRSMR